jgi:hypothetical protein
MQSSDYQQQYSYDRPPTGGGRGGFQPDRSKLLDYTLRGLGLVGVALVSGFIWFLIRNNPAQQPQAHTSGPTGPAGLYAFQPFSNPSTVTDCTAHSTDKLRVYLQEHPCVSLRRSLFTTTLPGGQKVITSVAVVRMSSQQDAAGLQTLSDRDATGHIKDLVEDGTQVPGGPSSLQNAGYHSALRGTRLVIVMTEYVDNTQDTQSNLQAHDKALKAVSADAAKQGVGLAN